MSPGGTERRSSLRRRHLIVLSVQLAATVLLLTLSGCSTAPFADMLDFFAPGRPPANAKDVAKKMIDRSTRLASRSFMQSSDRRCHRSVLNGWKLGP